MKASTTSKDVGRVALRTLLGALAGALCGYLTGALVGVIQTWQNNRMPDTPYGSYTWWANFFGLMLAAFAWLPGAGVGFFWGLIGVARRRARLKIGREALDQ